MNLLSYFFVFCFCLRAISFEGKQLYAELSIFILLPFSRHAHNAHAGSWLEVRSVSSRTVFITIFMATLVVYAHYTSALVSLLTVASTSVGFSSLQDLLHLGSYRLGFTAGTLLEQEFKVGMLLIWAMLLQE